MKYNFIRTGDKPVEEEANQFTLEDCFVGCVDEVKQELDDFFRDIKKQSIEFDFGSQKVRIERK